MGRCPAAAIDAPQILTDPFRHVISSLTNRTGRSGESSSVAFKRKTMRRSQFSLVAVATFLLVWSVPAQNVIFQFSGLLHTKIDAGNLLPASITATSAFTGTLSYGPATDLAPADPTYGYYIYSGAAGSLSMSATIAGNTISSVMPTNSPYDVFIIHDELPGNSYDELAYETEDLRLNGALMPGVDRANMDIDLQNSAGTGLNTDALPAYPPLLSQFPSLRRWALAGTGSGGIVYYLEGNITNITAVLPPVLYLAGPIGGNVTLSWTNLASAFLLEQSQTATGSWSQVPFPYVTNGGAISRSVGVSATNGFFRLRQP